MKSRPVLGRCTGFGCAQGNRTYRLEYTDDLKTPWQILQDHIPGTGDPGTIPDPSAQTIPQRFYRLVVVGQ